MKFEEVFPAYKEGRTIKYNIHKFKHGKESVIHSNWLDSEDWSICSKIEEYMDILRDIPCVDFRQYAAQDMLELNIIDILEKWDVEEEYSKEHELKEIGWQIPRKTKVHFVSDTHLTATGAIRLDSGGGVMFYDENSTYQYKERVQDIELIYLTENLWDVL